jgi:hypothetical protein
VDSKDVCPLQRGPVDVSSGRSSFNSLSHFSEQFCRRDWRDGHYFWFWMQNKLSLELMADGAFMKNLVSRLRRGHENHVVAVGAIPVAVHTQSPRFGSGLPASRFSSASNDETDALKIRRVLRTLMSVKGSSLLSSREIVSAPKCASA